AVAAAVRLLVEQAGTLERPLLERELRRGAHLRLGFGEARERLREQLVDAGTAVGLDGRERAHRPERRADDGGDEGASAREVAVRRRARDLRAHRDFGDRRHAALLADQIHRGVEQQPERRRLDAALWRARRFGETMLEAHHAGFYGAVRRVPRLWESRAGTYDAPIAI